MKIIVLALMTTWLEDKQLTLIFSLLKPVVKTDRTSPDTSSGGDGGVLVKVKDVKVNRYQLIPRFYNLVFQVFIY